MFKRFCSQVLVLCLVFLGIISWQAPGLAKVKTPARYVQIPVLYLTDRAEKGDGYDGTRKYVVNCKHDMYYGTVNVTVEAKDGVGGDFEQQKLGWKEIKRGKEGISLDKVKTGAPSSDKEAFFARLKSAMEKSGSNRICVFIHGAADPFYSAAVDSALLAYQIKCPVVLYSWPSLGKLKKYHVDEGNCEWSQLHFNMFWQDLEAFAADTPVSVTLVAHSVGNRILARAVSVIQGTKIVRDVALVSPDIDAEVFQHDVDHFRYNGVPIRLYFSERDKVLSFTQMVYGGYYRLGEDVAAVLNMFPPLKKPAVLNASQMGSGTLHSRRVDYTKLDCRWVGHHFPFELVASMSNFDTAPRGYVLVKGQAGKGNRYTRYESWKNDLKVPGEDDKAACWKVVKAPQAERGAPVSMKSGN